MRYDEQEWRAHVDRFPQAKMRERKSPVTDPTRWDWVWWVATAVLWVVFVTAPLWVTPLAR